MTAALHQQAGWNAAMQKVERANAASDASEVRWKRASRAYEDMAENGPVRLVFPRPRPDADLDRLTGYSGSGQVLEDAMDAASVAVDALILTPAPDLGALHWKMEQLFGETADAGAGTPAYCAEWGVALMNDVRRLLANGRA